MINLKKLEENFEKFFAKETPESFDTWCKTQKTGIMTQDAYLRMRPGNIYKSAEYFYPEYKHRMTTKGIKPMSFIKYKEKFNLEWGMDDDKTKNELTKIATEFNDNFFGV